uniref:Uncharacterized protein n=1 Tax=Solanum lycopersicum TaxID=4081 RepID=A0A3Q7I3X5_SOLLC
MYPSTHRYSFIVQHIGTSKLESYKSLHMMRSTNRLDWRVTDDGKIHISCKSPKFATQAVSDASISGKKTHIGVIWNLGWVGVGVVDILEKGQQIQWNLL